MDNNIIISESIICDALDQKYVNNVKYKLANVFIFKDDWESDFFLQKDNKYCYEFEVKISRSDFFNDKKKIIKHKILSEGKYINVRHKYSFNKELKKPEIIETIEKEIIYELRPNKFFYVVPENLITVNDIPSYSGLMYFNKENKRNPIKTIKEAPFIHKNKINFENKLCNKFYYYWIKLKMENNFLKKRIKELEIKYNNNK